MMKNVVHGTQGLHEDALRVLQYFVHQ